MAFDLSTHMGRLSAQEKIRNDIDQASISLFDDPHRRHLGASIIGHECEFYLWGNFRWLFGGNWKSDEEKARMLRLWQRGHREEGFQLALMREAGWIVTEFEPQILYWHSRDNEYRFCDEEMAFSGFWQRVQDNAEHTSKALALGLKQKQLRISFSGDHGGGSMDAIVEHPILFPGMKFLWEGKTYNEKQYVKLKVEGTVRKKSPQHYAQMSVYGRRKGIAYGLYWPVNKNDDQLTCIEIVELDHDLALHLENKADSIIRSQTPPEKLSLDPTYFKCRFCDGVNECHYAKPVQKNCRSCKSASAIDNGEWYCNRFNQVIPPDFIPKGCDQHWPLLP